MSNSFHLLVQMPNKICYDENIKQIDFCSEQGELSILPNHCSIIGCLQPTLLTIYSLSKKKIVAICEQGFFKFNNNKLLILTNFFSLQENFDKKTFLQENEKLINLLKKFDIPHKNFKKDFNLKLFSLSTKKIFRK